jgi:UDP-N-acetylenolpyruvoylglucosamine reductase
VAWPTAFADARSRAGSVARRTSFRIGGTPEYLFEPRTEEEAGFVLERCRSESIPLRVLGGGCNVLVSDGRLEGGVLWTGNLRFERVLDDRVEVGAGNSFASLVRRAADLGIPAISGCPGIPGSIGGVVSMNAGGRFGSAGDAVVEVAGYDAEGRRFRRVVEPGDMGYRKTAFEGCLVTSAAFRRDAHLDVAAERRRYVEASEWKHRTQPLAAASAGCMFKNPPGASAGSLIDRAGLKGERVGGAVVSGVHANFLVNERDARFDDVLALVKRVRDRVREASGVDLEMEVKVWR